MTTRDQTVSVHDIELRYQLVGEGEPLLLLHGFFGSGDTWSPILGGLEQSSQSYQLIIPDLRGHDGSTNPSGEFTMCQSALDIIALLDHLGIERVKAIGMSGGGMTLLHLATQQPDRVEALVLISATTHFPEQARTLTRSTTEEAQTEDSWDMMRTLHRRGDEQIRALWRVARGFADNHDDMAFTPDALSGVAAPTLVVHGDRDPFFPLEIALSMHAAIPTSWLWVVPNGGHLNLVAEGLSDQFVATASTFLRGDWTQP